MDHQANYANLEIQIRKQDEAGYPVQLHLDNKQQTPRGYLNSDIVSWFSSHSETKDGEQLFRYLFEDERLRQGWTAIRTKHPFCRVRLNIDWDSELHAIPWELLREPENLIRTPHTIAMSDETPFSRYLAGWSDPGSLITERPVRLLVAIASPKNLDTYNLAPIDVKIEQEIMTNATAGLSANQLKKEFLIDFSTLANLQHALKKGYHLVHIVAHGFFSHKSKESALYLVKENNEVDIVKASEFAAMIKQLHPKPRLIFLSSCQTANQVSAQAFRNFAHQLIEAGVPVVVAMQENVAMQTARAFAHTFYQELLAHGQVDLASNRARSHLLTKRLSGCSIPVLFSRLVDGRLLDNLSNTPSMSTIPDDFADRLLDILLNMPVLYSTGNRNTLLRKLPQHLRSTIPRDPTPTTDLTAIVDTAESWKQLPNSGELPLIIITKNALRFVKGSQQGQELEMLLEQFG